MADNNETIFNSQEACEKAQLRSRKIRSALLLSFFPVIAVASLIGLFSVELGSPWCYGFAALTLGSTVAAFFCHKKLRHYGYILLLCASLIAGAILGVCENMWCYPCFILAAFSGVCLIILYVKDPNLYIVSKPKPASNAVNEQEEGEPGWLDIRDAQTSNTVWNKFRAALGIYVGCALASIPVCYIWLSNEPIHPVLSALIMGGFAILIDLLMISSKDFPSAIRDARTFVTGIFRGIISVVAMVILCLMIYACSGKDRKQPHPIMPHRPLNFGNCPWIIPQAQPPLGEKRSDESPMDAAIQKILNAYMEAVQRQKASSPVVGPLPPPPLTPAEILQIMPLRKGLPENVGDYFPDMPGVFGGLGERLPVQGPALPPGYSEASAGPTPRWQLQSSPASSTAVPCLGTFH